ncbi:MAG: D-sedoheptulose-7-phosphate isomerase [Bdellovibrionia bacterium]
MEPVEYLKKTLKESMASQQAFIETYSQTLVQASRLMGETIQKGGKILILGNGGSAADAQHMAAEMIGKMLIDRKPLPALALTTDTSNLTAIGNDFGYHQVFLKQIQGLAKPGDVVIAISTSGNSVNVIEAVKAAKTLGCSVIGLTGGTGGALLPLCDLHLNAELAKNSSRTQETHIFAIHSLVDLLDRYFLDESYFPSLSASSATHGPSESRPLSLSQEA